MKIANELRDCEGIETTMLASVLQTLSSPSLHEIANGIGQVVNFELTKSEERVVVADGVDDHLDELKRAYSGLDTLLSQAALEIANSISLQDVAALSVLYFPQIGFLICLRLDLAESSGQETWEVSFTTSDAVYYKDPVTQRMLLVNLPFLFK